MTPLRALLHDSHFRRGARDMLDFAPGIAAWALVTGVAMAKSGLSLPLAVLMSLTVYAGSAQLASLPLLASGAPMWVIWAAAFCAS
jgi:predicted branched-subunit amino acid permease